MPLRQERLTGAQVEHEASSPMKVSCPLILRVMHRFGRKCWQTLSVGFHDGNMISSRKALLAGGHTPTEVRHQLHAGDLVRLRRGVYEQRDLLEVEPEARHRQQIRACAIRSDYPVSHASAIALHGLPVVDCDLSEVHVTRLGLGRSGNRHRGTRQVHSGRLDPSFCTVVDGIPVTTVARSVVDLARTAGRRSAVTAADAALHEKLCTVDEIAGVLDAIAGRPGVRRARELLDLCDGRSESPGETWTRLVLRDAGWDTSALQISIYNERGRFIGRADGGYPELGLFWEFDGMTKYGKLLKPGESALDAILREKSRESDMVELNWLPIRIITPDLRRPRELIRRFESAAQRVKLPGWLPPRGRYEIAPR